MRERIKVFVLPLVTWCKANFVTIFITALLVAAAIWSITYAYLNGRSTPLPVAIAETLQQTAEYQDYAQTDSSAGSSQEGSVNDNKHASQATATAKTTEDNSTTETLGATVDCKEIEQQARRQLEKAKDKQAIKDAYSLYERAVSSKGCSTLVNLGELLTNIENSLPAVPKIL